MAPEGAGSHDSEVAIEPDAAIHRHADSPTDVRADSISDPPATDGNTETVPRHVSAEERAKALAAGSPRIPREVVVWILVAVAILGLGGAVGERIFSAAGLNASAGSSGATTTTTRTFTTIPTSGPLSSSGALLALERLRPVPAPGVGLDDQHGNLLSLSGLRGKIVVLTFFNASCDDVCPVIAAELRRAETDLGALRSHVVFVTINTDPLELSRVPAPSAVTRTGLDALDNWHFLTGPISRLNPLWSDLGLSISVYVDQRTAVHNDLLYLIDAHGDLVVRGSPFADESRSGDYSLPAPLVRIAAKGIVSAVLVLLGVHR